MPTSKNYSYLAIRLQKFWNDSAARVQEQAFHAFAEHCFSEISGAAVRTEPESDGEGDEATHATHMAQIPSAANKSAATGAGWELGFHALASVVVLHLRSALRRWETFVRRKRFDDLQSRVVKALQKVPSPPTKPPKEHIPIETQAEATVDKSPPLQAQPLQTVKESPFTPMGQICAQDVLQQIPRDTMCQPSKHDSSDVVHSLAEDQARVDEIIKLAALLWESGSLVHVQPMALLKASLLVRMAERCQKHVLREAVQLLWRRCSLQRSVEELLAQGELVQRQKASLGIVTQPHTASHAEEPQLEHTADLQDPPVDGSRAAEAADAPNQNFQTAQTNPEANSKPSKSREEQFPERPSVVSQPSANYLPLKAEVQPAEEHLSTGATHQPPFSRGTLDGTAETERPSLGEARERNYSAPESDTSVAEDSEINDDELADLLG
mmetsp:Transcript_66962/g.157880  ORF Transcript_66962/g.157880 Transcript_66962/m.157880 type:complete len:439 (+) Transcript_66962:55-1371(+)